MLLQCASDVIALNIVLSSTQSLISIYIFMKMYYFNNVSQNDFVLNSIMSQNVSCTERRTCEAPFCVCVCVCVDVTRVVV